MQQLDVTDHPIRKQVLRAIALNREPGYHFCGNFFDTVFARVADGHSRLLLDPGSHCTDSDGRLNIGVFALLADMGLATSIRSALDRSTRLATVSLDLQFTGAACSGRLEAASDFQCFLEGASGRQGLSQVAVRGGAGGSELVCFGSGAFMVLPPPGDKKLHPIPWCDREPPEVALPRVEELDSDELWILRHAELSLATSLAGKANFINRFLGYEPHPARGGASCGLVNGPHISNRVGHVQGGILLGLAAVTADTALGEDWSLSGISACYLSPGEGQILTAKSEIVHHGRFTAVIRTQVSSSNGRQVLEVTSTHARRADTEQISVA
jgi:acyl-coenzyme A thioesterase PaaI-like protein